MLSLAGCAQQVEKEPVSVKDEMAQMDPVESETENREGTDTPNETAEENQEEAAKGAKEQLANVKSLEDAPKELIIQETVDGNKKEKKLILQKCDGGFGFYFPEHEDANLAWNLEEENNGKSEELFFFGSFNNFYNGAGMDMTVNCIEDATLDNAKEMVEDIGITRATSETTSENTVAADTDILQSQAEECTIGAGDYPAIRTPFLTVPAPYAETPDPEVENAVENRVQVTVQYCFVECPEGLLQMDFIAPAEGMEASWKDVEEILDTMIIEDKDTYQDYHSAVSINARDRELKFSDIDILRTFYDTCHVRRDYDSAMKISKNITPQENGKEVWEKMICYPFGVAAYIEREGRAFMPCSLILDEPGDTGLPRHAETGGKALVRYMYFVKEGDYWYLDGPLHNAEPTEEWWRGEVTSWEDHNYGLSDSAQPGTVLMNDEELNSFINAWDSRTQ